MLETLTSGTEKEKQELMSICVDILSNYSMTDLVTPIFVFEQLCNIIHPVSYIVTEKYSLLIAVFIGGRGCWRVLSPAGQGSATRRVLTGMYAG